MEAANLFFEIIPLPHYKVRQYYKGTTSSPSCSKSYLWNKCLCDTDQILWSDVIRYCVLALFTDTFYPLTQWYEGIQSAPLQTYAGGALCVCWQWALMLNDVSSFLFFIAPASMLNNSHVQYASHDIIHSVGGVHKEAVRAQLTCFIPLSLFLCLSIFHYFKLPLSFYFSLYSISIILSIYCTSPCFSCSLLPPPSDIVFALVHYLFLLFYPSAFCLYLVSVYFLYLLITFLAYSLPNFPSTYCGVCMILPLMYFAPSFADT